MKGNQFVKRMSDEGNICELCYENEQSNQNHIKYDFVMKVIKPLINDLLNQRSQTLPKIRIAI